MADYSADSIQLLEGVEAIRRRPGMYVGDTRDGGGLRVLLWEVVGNCVDEHLAGRATGVRVNIEDQLVTVEDDGPGIPIDVVPDRGKTAIEIIFTELRASSGPKHPHVHIGESLRGLGCIVASALSKRLEVETTRDGRRYRMVFERGRVVGELADLGETDRIGTWIRFEPDPEIFESVHWDLPLIRDRLFDLACLDAGLVVVLNGETMQAPDGLAHWVRTHSGAPAIDPIHLRGEHDGIRVEIAMRWIDGEGVIAAWASHFRTLEGSHVHGFWEGLAEVLTPGLMIEAAREHLEPGLVAAFHADIEDPRFGSPTRSRLDTPEAATAVTHVLRSQLPAAYGSHPALLELSAKIGVIRSRSRRY